MEKKLESAKFIILYKKVFGEEKYKSHKRNLSPEEMKQKLEYQKIIEPWKFD